MATLCELRGFTSTIPQANNSSDVFENIAGKYNITKESAQALLEVIQWLAPIEREDKTINALRSWSYLLHRDSLGELFNGSLDANYTNDFVVELRLTRLGVDVAKDLITKSYPLNSLLEVVNDARVYYSQI